MQSILSFVLLLVSTAAFSQNYLEINKFLASQYDGMDDISYIQMHPQYEPDQPADKGVILEFYNGEYDGSEKSKQSLELIKSIAREEVRLNPSLKISTLIYGKNYEDIEESEKIKDIQNTLSLNGKSKNEIIPTDLNFNYEAKAEGRSPDSIKIGRVGWTFIRGIAVSGSSFASLIITQGLSAPLAASVAIWPGVLSGAITYHNGAFGEYLTNGKWAKWLMNSDKWFAKKIRSAFNINYNSLGKKLAQNPRYFRVKYPNLYKNNPELFEKFVARKAGKYGESRFKSLVKKFTMAEEYFKWYLTEVIFVGGAIKVPQAIAGIGSNASLLGATGDVLLGSAYGMAAQGPGDLAIQKRKYQKFDELLAEAKGKSAKFTAAEKSQIIEQIEKIKDPNVSYQIGKGSHKSLQKIENWARSRATMISFFSVAGVSLEMAGIPAAKPVLIATGLGGGFYYAHVSGWIKFSNIKTVAKNAVASFGKFLKNPIKVIYSSITTRMCQSPFLMPQFK